MGEVSHVGLDDDYIVNCKEGLIIVQPVSQDIIFDTFE